jgi:hypothetical protein
MSNPLPQSLSSLRPETKANLEFDAGQIWVNGNVEAFRASGLIEDLINVAVGWTDPNLTVVYPRRLSATRGGNVIGVGKTERQVEADGRRTRIKGLVRVDMIEPMLKVKLLECADAYTARLIMGSTYVDNWPSAGGPDFQYMELTPSLIVLDGDYVGNICVLSTVSGETQPMVYVLDNARVDNIADMTLVDHNEKVAEVTIYGHALLESPLDVPLHQFIPVLFSGGS